MTHQAPFYIKPRMDFKMYPVLVVSAIYDPSESVPDVCGLVMRNPSTSSKECFVFVLDPDFEVVKWSGKLHSVRTIIKQISV